MAEVGWSGRGKCIQLYLKNNKKNAAIHDSIIPECS